MIYDVYSHVRSIFWSDICVPSPAIPIVPTCEILHSITPAAWTSSSLSSMSPSAFSNCLELMGHDPFLASYQRGQLLNKVKQVRVSFGSFTYLSDVFNSGPCSFPSSVQDLILCVCSVYFSGFPLESRVCVKMYGPVSSFPQSLISQLGRLALELTVDELSSLRLIERRSIAALGAVSDWSGRQVTA